MTAAIWFPRSARRAWNRLVRIEDGTWLVGTYGYDALTRRVTKTTAVDIRNYYYNSQWRTVEEREGGIVMAQYTWNPTDRWSLIRRTRSVTGTLDESRYVLKDYLDPVWNAPDIRSNFYESSGCLLVG